MNRLRLHYWIWNSFRPINFHGVERPRLWLLSWLILSEHATRTKVDVAVSPRSIRNMVHFEPSRRVHTPRLEFVLASKQNAWFVLAPELRHC